MILLIECIWFNIHRTSLHHVSLTIQLNYKANYEKTKNQYTISQDTPGFKNAKANAELVSDVSLHCTYKYQNLDTLFVIHIQYIVYRC